MHSHSGFKRIYCRNIYTYTYTHTRTQTCIDIWIHFMYWCLCIIQCIYAAINVIKWMRHFALHLHSIKIIIWKEMIKIIFKCVRESHETQSNMRHSICVLSILIFHFKTGFPLTVSLPADFEPKPKKKYTTFSLEWTGAHHFFMFFFSYWVRISDKSDLQLNWLHHCTTWHFSYHYNTIFARQNNENQKKNKKFNNWRK